MVINLLLLLCFDLVHPQIIHSISDTYFPFINPLVPHFGQELILTCPLESNPQASYKWYFKNESSERNDPFIMIDEEHNDRQVSIDEFLEEDNGRYLCSAENYLGIKNFTFPPFHVSSKYYLSIRLRCFNHAIIFQSVRVSTQHIQQSA